MVESGKEAVVLLGAVCKAVALRKDCNGCSRDSSPFLVADVARNILMHASRRNNWGVNVITDYLTDHD